MVQRLAAIRPMRRRVVLAGLAAAAVEGEARAQSAPTAPYLLRGTVSGRLWPGVTLGEAGPTARRTNLLSLQAALDFASAHRKFFELEPGLYELEGATGLVIPASKNGFEWRGSKESMLKQFSNDCPVLTVGDATNRGIHCQGLHLSGARVFYANDQSGQPRSSALQIGLLRNSIIENVSVLADYSATGPLVKAYRGIHITSASGPFGFFSNSLRDIFVAGADYSLMDVALVGTGSVFSNIYLTQGVTGHPAPISDSPLRIVGAADQYETVFEQLNIEWCAANALIKAQSCRATSFISMHLEGNQLRGSASSAIALASSQIILIGVNLLDLEAHTPAVPAEGAPPAVLRCYGDNVVHGSNVQVSWSGSDRLNTGLQLVAVNESSPADAQQIVSVANLVVRDVSGLNAKNLSLDANLPAASFPLPSAIENYRFGDVLSQVAGGLIATNTDMTVFGQYERPLIQYPAALGAVRTVTLAKKMKPSGAGSTIPPAVGALAGVRRDSGVADGFGLVVANHDATGLATLLKSGATRWFRFDGANWAAVA